MAYLKNISDDVNLFNFQSYLLFQPEKQDGRVTSICRVHLSRKHIPQGQQLFKVLRLWSGKMISFCGPLVPAPLRTVYIWNHNLCAARVGNYFVRGTLVKTQQKTINT